MNIFIILFFIFYFVLSLKRQDWALMLLLFLLPSYQIRFDVFGIPSTLLEGMILILFAVWVVKNFKIIFENLKLKIKNCLQITNYKLQITKRYPFDIEIILFLIISWIAIAVAGFSSSALGIWKAYFFEPVLVYILIFNIIYNANAADEKRMPRIANYANKSKYIIWPLVLSVFCVSFVAVFQRIGLFASPENFWPRVTGPFPYPNAVGLFVGPLLPIILGLLVSKLVVWKIAVSQKIATANKDYLEMFVLAVTFLWSIAALLLAKSEGALVGIFIAFGFMALFTASSFFKKKIFTLFNFILLGVVILFIFVSPLVFLQVVPENKYFNFSQSVFNYISDKAMLKDFSGEVRKQQWRETWEVLKQDGKWFWGFGLANYQTSVKDVHQEGIFFNEERDPRFYNELVWGPEDYKWAHWRPVEIYLYPHNLLLNFWVEIGLLGVVVFVFIIFKSIKCLVSNIKQGNFFAMGLLGALVVILVHGIVDVPYFKNDLAVGFWVLLALIGMMKINKEKWEK